MGSVFEAYEPMEPQEGNDAVDKLQSELIELGLTNNEAKIYIYLAKHGNKKASEISKSINIIRTETYHLLSNLQNKGLVTATLEHPIRFNAIPFDKALKLLIKIHEEKLRKAEAKKSDLLDLWQSIPDFVDNKISEQPNFQILKGWISIFSKARDMRARAKQELLVLGDEKDFLKLDHFDFMDSLVDTHVTVKFLTHCLSDSAEVFEGMKVAVKQIPKNTNVPSFIVTDKSELLFFINNNDVKNKEMLAIWTDSQPLLQAMHMLFDELWDGSIPLRQPIKTRIVKDSSENAELKC